MLRDAFAPLVDLVYPPRCPLCGGGVGTQSGLCVSCWSELAIPTEPACASCQRPVEYSDSGEETVCGFCLAEPPPQDAIAAGTLYNDAARKLVLSFKHGRKIGLAPLMARLIAPRLPPLEGQWIAVPVPLHRWRLWQRGYNQSALLAAELAKLRDLEVMVDALFRRKYTRKLGGLGKIERAAMLSEAIVANPARLEALEGAQVILVDDVLTSGATPEACISALRRAGARKVIIACFSRVLDEAL